MQTANIVDVYVAANTDRFKLALIGPEGFSRATKAVIMRMVIVQRVIRVGAKLRRKVLRGHGAVDLVSVAIELDVQSPSKRSPLVVV